jgi:hypothetical protein
MIRGLKRGLVFGGLLVAAVGARWMGVGFRYELDWGDRRPIGALFISSSGHQSRTNPRGWLNDPTIDVTTPAGVRAFEERLLRWADQSVLILKEINAQGMVVWDIEGQQDDGYVGDPRQAVALAPELAGVVDRFFGRFREAGLRVGVTVRPQRYEGGRQRLAWDAAGVLEEKIRYARGRWGATLFYIDSNRIGPLPFDPGVVRRVARENPGILLIPEHETPAYFAFSAPLQISGRERMIQAPWARKVWPRAFSVITVNDADFAREGRELAEAVEAGDVLMVHGWFRSEANRKVRELYKSRGRLSAP